MFNNMRFSALSEKSPIQGALLRSLGRGGDLSIASLRSLSPLSDKAQVMVDNAVLEVGVERLTFVQDLMSSGLVFNLPDPLSVTQLEWETINKVGGAQRTMSPSARGEFQMPKRVVHRLPIYLTTDDFSIGIRTLKMSQRVGQPLDTTLVSQATRRVNEALEDAAINGATTIDGEDLEVGGYNAPGLLNAPNANAATGITAADYAAGTINGANIVDDILEQIAVLQGKNFWGPYNYYIPTALGTRIQKDYSTDKGEGSVMTRLRLIEAGGRPLNVRVTDRMPANKTALIQMTNDVVDLVNGQPPTVIPWTSLDGFTLFWLVMAIQVPRFRSNQNGESGISIATIV